MARASTYTLIPLDRAAEHLGVSPWHFNGIETENHPFTPSCSDDWYQFNYQSVGKLSREALAQALFQAEQTTERFLGFPPAPRWYEDTVKIMPYYRVERRNISNSRGMALSATTKKGHVFEVGARASTFIDNPATNFTDSDLDGTTDTVTVSVVTTVTDPEEIRVYYPSKDGADVWEIRPLTSVTIAGGTATIVFPKYLCALQELQEKIPSPDNPYIGIDGDDDTNFLRTVDVYRVYTDMSNPATLYYEPGHACNNIYDYDTNSGSLYIRDERLGIMAFHRATWDTVTESFAVTDFTNYPDKIKMNYRAGRKDDSLSMPTREMNREYERLITYYALSLLDTELCGCDNTRNIWQYMTRDLAKNDGSTSYMMPWNKLGNPFGTSFAAIRLWESIQPDKINRPPSRW